MRILIAPTLQRRNYQMFGFDPRATSVPSAEALILMVPILKRGTIKYRDNEHGGGLYTHADDALDCFTPAGVCNDIFRLRESQRDVAIQ